MDERNQPSKKRNAPSAPPLPVVDAAELVAGVDLGDQTSEVCLYAKGVVFERFQFAMTDPGVREAFAGKGYGKIAMEAGAQSPWVTRVLRELGYEPLVANPRKLKAISANERKSDRNDALLLAKLAAADSSLLYPIHHRSAERADALAVLKARDALVRARARLIHTIRSLAKATGFRFKKSTTEGFARQEASAPAALAPAFTPLFAALRPLGEQIVVIDKQLERMAEHSFPETRHLLQIHGVGPITALAFVLTIEDPKRFASGRIAAAFLGLVPRRDQSGTSDKQLGISKTGNNFVRRLVVQCAQYILGPFGQDCDLRRWGHKLVQRGGKNSTKRAVVATARKLVVLLFRLWKGEQVWEPLFNAGPVPAADPSTPVREDLPDTPVLGDCAGPLDDTLARGRRAPDCSTDGGSDPSMHRVQTDPSTSADRSVDTGKTSTAAPSKTTRQNRPPRSVPAPATPSAPASPACAGVPAVACTPTGRPVRTRQGVRPGAEPPHGVEDRDSHT